MPSTPVAPCTPTAPVPGFFTVPVLPEQPRQFESRIRDLTDKENIFGLSAEEVRELNLLYADKTHDYAKRIARLENVPNRTAQDSDELIHYYLGIAGGIADVTALVAYLRNTPVSKNNSGVMCAKDKTGTETVEELEQYVLVSNNIGDTHIRENAFRIKMIKDQLLYFIKKELIPFYLRTHVSSKTLTPSLFNDPSMEMYIARKVELLQIAIGKYFIDNAVPLTLEKIRIIVDNIKMKICNRTLLLHDMNALMNLSLSPIAVTAPYVEVAKDETEANSEIGKAFRAMLSD
ncbi:MAG: hypothetical protein NTZ67_00870 [Gammaproteobacteria bacterium]|nr:hypothetical protein [Gammaproteobacteria bacterium]